MKRLIFVFLLLAQFSYGAANYRQISTAGTFTLGPFIKIADGSYEDAAAVGSISITFIKYSSTVASNPAIVTTDGTTAGCVFKAKGTYLCNATSSQLDTLGTTEVRATYTGTYGAKTSLEITHANSMAILQAGTIGTPQSIWDVLTSAASVTAGGMGERVVNGLDLPVSSLIAYSTRMAGTTITVIDQTHGTIAAGSTDNNAYPVGSIAIIIDQATPTQQCATTLSNYVGSSKTYTLASICPFTIATGDLIRIFAHPSSAVGVDANVVSWNGVVVPTSDTPGYPKVTIKDGTGQGELSITAGQQDGMATPTDVANAVWAGVGAGLLDLPAGVETGLTIRKCFRAIMAVTANKSSGYNTNTPTFRDFNDSKNRITSTTANTGRTSVTFDLD